MVFLISTKRSEQSQSHTLWSPILRFFQFLCVPSLREGYDIFLLDTEIQHMLSIEFKDK